MFNKEKIKNSFSQSAATYDQFALLQKKVGQDFIFRKLSRKNFRKILDIGMGTGELLRLLGKTYPQAEILCGCDIALGMCKFTAGKNRREHNRIVTINADGESLPFSTESFDLIYSNLTFQWFNDLPQAFGEIKRVLKKGGRFHFTILGEGTLNELKTSCQHVLKGDRDNLLHHFPDLFKIKQAMQAAGFKKIQAMTNTEIEFYPSVPALLKNLKYIGAQNARSQKSGLMLTPPETKKMLRYYEENFRDPAGVRATYLVYTLSGVR